MKARNKNAVAPASHTSTPRHLAPNELVVVVGGSGEKAQMPSSNTNPLYAAATSGGVNALHG